MKKKLLIGLSTFCSLIIVNNSNSASTKKENILFNKFQPKLEIRPRYEYVDVKNNNLKSANALTTRIYIGLNLKDLFHIKNLETYLETNGVFATIDNYSPEDTKYEQVPDPVNTRFTQIYIKYKLNKTNFFIGRKFVNIDDHRFIGNVDWRQMPQSFGVIAISDNTVKNLDLLVAGIYERKGIVDRFNRYWEFGKWPLIVDVNYKTNNLLKIKFFSYLITDINNTYGIKLSGEYKFSYLNANYILEYAKQTDPYKIDNVETKPDIDTNYYRFGVNTNIRKWTIGLEYTHFGDRNGKDKGFSTPLATLHAFDGWSDVLLLGGANGFDYGLREYKLNIGYENAKYGKFLVSYLIFKSYKSQPTGNNIGTEIDLLYTKNLTKRLSLLLKSAFYNGDNGYFTEGSLRGQNDVNKFWAQLDFKY